MVTAAALRWSVLTTETLRPQPIFSLVKKIVFKIVFCWIRHVLLESKKISKHSGKPEEENHQICVGLLFIKLCLNPKCRIRDKFEQYFIVEVHCHEWCPWLRVICVGCSWTRFSFTAVRLSFVSLKNNVSLLLGSYLIPNSYSIAPRL